MITTMKSIGDGAFGLLIGVSSFCDPLYARRPLPHAAHDANDLASILQHSLGWNSNHLEILTGVVTKKAIVEGFSRIQEKVRQVEPAELFLLYISTHGHAYKSVRRAFEVTLLTTDGSLANPLQMYESTLTRQLIGFCMDSVSARQKAIVIDACYAAGVATAEELVPFDSRELDAAVLASSTRNSYASHSSRNSEFTGALLEGIRSLAGHTVGLTDLFSLVSQNQNLSPYLDNKGRYITFGASTRTASAPPRTSTSFKEFFVALLNAVAERGRHSPFTDSYVVRFAQEGKFDQLVAKRIPIISVVGPPGGGKTTFLLRSARRAIASGAGVVWVGPTEVRKTNAAAILACVLAPLGAALTLGRAIAESHGTGPWLIILDGVNEWSMSPEDTKKLLLNFEEEVSTFGATLVLSCREESWRTFREAFWPGQKTAMGDVVIANFDDTEINQIVPRVGHALSGVAGSVLRRPLFVRMLLDAQSALDIRTLDLVDLFRAYVENRSNLIAMRLGSSASSILSDMRTCARWMLNHNTVTMPVGSFFRMLNEATCLALLEEGFCVRSGGKVGLESETLLEYLISLELPDDPFEGIDFSDRRSADIWWGAAAFKASKLEPDRLRVVLNKLADNWGSQEYALSLMARLPDPSQHTVVVESLAGEEFLLSETLHRFLNELLDRGTSQTTVVMQAVRSYIIGRLGSWRPKDWQETTPHQFDERLTNKLGAEIGLVVIRAHQIDPVVTFDMLGSWLHDTSYLADDEAHVSDFASLFLRHLGCRDIGGLVSAIERLLSHEDEQTYSIFTEVRHILAFVGKNRRDASISSIVRWTSSDNQLLRVAATELVPAVPGPDTVALLDALKRYAQRDDVLDEERANAIASIGSRGTRAALNFLLELSELEECQAGVVRAYNRLAASFPVELQKRIDAFNEEKPLRSDVIEALNNFHGANIQYFPRSAVAFFRKLEREYPGRYIADIAHTIHMLKNPVPEATDFVEEHLIPGSSGSTLERFHYYLRKVRSLRDSDIPWVRSWIDSGDGTYGLVSYLLNSDLSYQNKAELYVKLDTAGPKYGNDLYDLDQGGRGFVQRFHQDPRFDELTEDGKIWVTEVVRGKSAWEAARAITEARIAKLTREISK